MYKPLRQSIACEPFIVFNVDSNKRPLWSLSNITYLVNPNSFLNVLSTWISSSSRQKYKVFILFSLISFLLASFFGTLLVNFLRAMTETAESLLFVCPSDLLDVLHSYTKTKRNIKVTLNSFIATIQYCKYSINTYLSNRSWSSPRYLIEAVEFFKSFFPQIYTMLKNTGISTQ